MFVGFFSFQVAWNIKKCSFVFKYEAAIIQPKPTYITKYWFKRTDTYFTSYFVLINRLQRLFSLHSTRMTRMFRRGVLDMTVGPADGTTTLTTTLLLLSSTPLRFFRMNTQIVAWKRNSYNAQQDRLPA